MTALAQDAKKLAVQIIQNEAHADKLAWFNHSMNIDHDRKLLFVHNPKCMGTSMRKWLGLRVDNADHRFPTLMVNKECWEAYRTIVVVRHPIDRFISSYNFHCRSDYSGGYLTRFPDLKSWSMEQYFFRMTSVAPLAVSPQWKYAMHLSSEMGPTHLIRMESPSAELGLVASSLGIEPLIPRLNQNRHEKQRPSAAFLRTLEQYYRRDFDEFGY
jgi:hypothetical protein